jgi:hypothetical protein
MCSENIISAERVIQTITLLLKKGDSGMSIDNILHEASTVLHAALRYSSQFSESDKIENQLFRMRVLITRVAAHNFTTTWISTNYSSEIQELQNIKEVILRKAEERFGSSSKVLSEFHYSQNPSS